MPWDVQRLAFPQLEALEEGARERFNRTARLAAWFMANLPQAVYFGVAMYMEGAAQVNLKKHRWTPKALLRSIPGYRPLIDPEDDE